MDKDSTSKNILLVDTDADFMELATICLSLEGYRVFQAENGLTAVEKIQNNNLSCIITELLLPMMDGFRLLNWLRDEMKLKIPVLVLTAIDRIDTEERAREAGASGIIFKPVNDLELLGAVNELHVNSGVTKTPSPPVSDPLKCEEVQFFQNGMPHPS